MQGFKQAFAAIAGALLFFIALGMNSSGFQDVLDFRMLERIPLTTIEESVGGETQLRGEVLPGPHLLKTPKSRTPSVYYRYTIEEEYEDSDGDTHWREIHSETKAMPFVLRDDSEQVTVQADMRQRIQWNTYVTFKTIEGDKRYTEWSIEPGQAITIFGWLETNEPAQVLFTQKGNYVPIISAFSARDEREDRGTGAVFSLWGGMSCLVLMCFCVLYTLRQHRILLFLGLVTVSSSFLFFYYGVRSLEADVVAGFERVESQRQRTEDSIQRVLAGHDLSFPGWQATFVPGEGDYVALSTEEVERINAWLHMAYLVRARYLQQIQRFPEKPYAWLHGMAKPQAILLPPEQQAIADAKLGAYQPTRLAEQMIPTVIALLLIVAFAWFAFRVIRVKRMQENLPTSKTAGAVFGLIELKGRLVEDTPHVLGPISDKPCVWYHYRVEEKRGSGKDASWVTVTDETHKQPFYCEDDEGRMRVFPTGAEVITKHSSKRTSSSYRSYEKRLEPGDELYLLGKAKTDKTRGDALVLGHEKGNPFIVANLTEAQVMMKKASTAMLLLSAGISLLFGVGLWIAGSNGNFSSADFMLSALIAPSFAAVLMLVVMYNDLVFLKRRCDRNWSNIDVSLKKRATLIPQLERVVKRYLEHEAELQQGLVSLREQGRQVSDTASADSYMAAESQVIDKLEVCLERYPDLQGHKAIADFHKRLIKLENEVALMRDGFNDAVTQYNTRIQIFPDNLLASIFRFQAMNRLRFDQAAHALPVVDLSMDKPASEPAPGAKASE